jgi:hypothetical protein
MCSLNYSYNEKEIQLESVALIRSHTQNHGGRALHLVTHVTCTSTGTVLNLFSENLNGRDHLRNLGVDERIILKLVLMK